MYIHLFSPHQLDIQKHTEIDYYWLLNSAELLQNEISTLIGNSDSVGIKSYMAFYFICVGLICMSCCILAWWWYFIYNNQMSSFSTFCRMGWRYITLHKIKTLTWAMTVDTYSELVFHSAGWCYIGKLFGYLCAFSVDKTSSKWKKKSRAEWKLREITLHILIQHRINSLLTARSAKYKIWCNSENTLIVRDLPLKSPHHLYRFRFT